MALLKIDWRNLQMKQNQDETIVKKTDIYSGETRKFSIFVIFVNAKEGIFDLPLIWIYKIGTTGLNVQFPALL